MKTFLRKSYLLILLIAIVFMIKCGPDKELEILPLTNQTIPANRTFMMNIIASNTSGESLSWSVEAPTITERNFQIEGSSTGAVFRWTPLSSQLGTHTITFVATGSSSSGSASVVITVIQAEGAPFFVQPGDGNTFDLSRNPCIKFNVEVKDDDSVSVDISEVDPLYNETHLVAPSKVNPKKTTWEWCPTPEQVNTSDRYTVNLQASDGDHEPTSKIYNIIIRGQSKPDCPGELPKIESTSPPPPEKLATSKDYEIVATITDENPIKENPILYYSFDPPIDPAKPDVTQMKQVLFERLEGNTWHAYIPNLNLPLGEEKTVYYVISVKDDDDPKGTGCDHLVDGDLQQFIVTAPTEEELAKYCEHCSRDSQCESGVCVYADESFCGRYCVDGCVDGTCQEIVSVEGIVTEQCVPDNLDCSGTQQTCQDNSNNSTSSTAIQLAIDQTEDQTLCNEEDDYYTINLEQSQPVDIVISGWDTIAGDLDLYLLNNDLITIYSSENNDSSEQITPCLTNVENPYYIKVVSYLYEGNSLSYTINVANSTGGDCCNDDSNESNNSAEEATSIETGIQHEAQICPGNNDWYSFIVDSAPMHVNIAVSFDESMGGDIDIELFRNLGDSEESLELLSIGSSNSTGTGEETIDMDVNYSGTYYLNIYSSYDINNSYNFMIEVSDQISSCVNSSTCEIGTVCDPESGWCINDNCDPLYSYCPGSALCPAVPSFSYESSCVDICTDNSDCREGYACKPFGDEKGCAFIFANGQTGDPCMNFEDCGGERICYEATTGYCAKVGCEMDNDCPSDSVCVEMDSGETVCLKDCYTEMCSNDYECQCASNMQNSLKWVCVDPETMPITNAQLFCGSF